jgi:hypothetical protein
MSAAGWVAGVEGQLKRMGVIVFVNFDPLTPSALAPVTRSSREIANPPEEGSCRCDGRSGLNPCE